MREILQKVSAQQITVGPSKVTHRLDRSFIYGEGSNLIVVFRKKFCFSVHTMVLSIGVFRYDADIPVCLWYFTRKRSHIYYTNKHTPLMGFALKWNLRPVLCAKPSTMQIMQRDVCVFVDIPATSSTVLRYQILCVNTVSLPTKGNRKRRARKAPP